jgi:hypothetical protein
MYVKIPLRKVYVDSLQYQVYERYGQLPQALRHFEAYQAGITPILTMKQASKMKKLEHEFEIKEKNLTILNQQLQVDSAQKRFLAQVFINLSILFVLVGSGLFV